jgi:hypothetical protein
MQIKITMNNVINPDPVLAKAAELGLTVSSHQGLDVELLGEVENSSADAVQSDIVGPLMQLSEGCWSTTEYTF